MPHAFFYNSVDGDRVYDADSFSDWLKKFFTTGVFEGDLQVIVGDGMKISVQPGYCNINGKVMLWDAVTNLDVTVANATYDRIDTVVIERNDTDRDFYLKVITGSATDTPRATAPVRTRAVYQLVLAQIYVKAGTTSLKQSDITDTRMNSSLCGYVAGTVKEIDFNQIKEQYETWFNEVKSNQADREDSSKQEFEDWFAGLKNELDSNQAANLQNQINALNDRTQEATEAEIREMMDARFPSISILGNSYSAYDGDIYPLSNAKYFPSNDVSSCADMWYRKLADGLGAAVRTNASYSGARVGSSASTTSSYVGRVGDVKEAEYIFIEGGLNDTWNNEAIGDYVYSDWTEDQLKTFRGAACYVVSTLQTKFPNAKLYWIADEDVGADYKTSLQAICEHYSIKYIEITGIGKANSHPTKAGMASMADQIRSAL